MKNMLNLIKVPLVLTLAGVLCTTGCQQTSQRTAQTRSGGLTTQQRSGGYTSQQMSQRRPVDPAPAAAPAARPAPARPAPQVGCVNTTSGLIQMGKKMPSEATLGSEFSSELVIDAQGCAANVVVRDSIPENATYVRSEPPATVEGNQLVWKIGNMDAGQVINARVWFRAEKEGTIVNCAWVSADPRVCGATFVGKPVLAIDKSGPATAVLGTDAVLHTS
ncbi:MAG TPA: hypothetical protein DCY13_23190, partial [Verrucomicrobiales bacterium]|nr:hypothetical protein [Verrucomicrobiales bacterium]